MVRGFLLLSIAATLYASSDYVPFSKFSQTEQIEYNFKKAEIDNTERIEEVKQIKKVSIRNYKKPTTTNLIEKTKIRKTIVPKIKESNLIPEEIEQVEKEVVQKIEYKKDILYSASLIYSPLTANYSDSTRNDSHKSNLIEPNIAISFGEHKIEANYFKSDNDFFVNENLDTTWYKVAYKYSYENTNIGLAVNHIVFDGNLLDGHDTFPSLEIDFKNSSGLLELEYGGSVGVGDQVDYSYEYFFNVNIKPAIHSEESFVIGYKNRTLNLKVDDPTADEHKLEFTGPYVGINTKF